MSEKKNRGDPIVGRNNPGRDAIGAAMRFTTSITDSDSAQRYDFQPKIGRVMYQSTKSGFGTLDAVNRQFRKISGSGKPECPAEEIQAVQEAAAEEEAKGFFDFVPTEGQWTIIETVKKFAESRLHEAVYKSDHETTPPENLVSEASELGVTMINVPEVFEGIAIGEDATTNALVTEALSHGDMGLALAVPASIGVAATLTAHDSDSQQKTYLPASADGNILTVAVVLAEPRPLFDARKPETTVKREGDSLALNSAESLVPNTGTAKLFIISVEFEGKPALVIVESDIEGSHIEAGPSMDLHGAVMGRVILRGVKVPAENTLGGASTLAAGREKAYLDILCRSRPGWAALIMDTPQAALDYIIPYVNERQIFDEPISHRRAAAFMVADIKIKLDGLRMITLRGAFRADQGCGFVREAALVKTFAAEKSMKIGSDGVQLLDGHSFIKEYPVGHWYRDLHAIGVAEGIIVL